MSTLIVWLPFLLRTPDWAGVKIEKSGFDYLYRNYDGPLYVIAAKDFYVNSPKYFAAHLPLYPALIRGGKEMMELAGLNGDGLGYLKSMISVNVLATVALGGLFYFILKRFRLSSNPLLLTVIFMFLPRYLVVRTVGAPESIFIFLILSSLYFFEKEKYILAGLLGGLSVMTKTPGILLFGAYSLAIAEKLIRVKKIDYKWLGILLIPGGLLAVFMIYWRQMGDFFAYFNSGDNIHLVFPFSVFNFQKTWIGTAWLEDILFYFLLYGMTIVTLWKTKYRSFFYFSLLFFLATLFIQHRDIARYSLPLWPMALIAFEKFFISKKFVAVYSIIVIGAFFYAWNFITYNIMPIADWSHFM